MKKSYPTVDYDALLLPTGDPFVDASGYALKTLSAYYPDADILELIRLATRIYVDNWDAEIYRFFLNSTITQSNFDTPERKKEETELYFTRLLEETLPYTTGYCRVTGRKTKLFPAGRNNSVLTGSRRFVNFHHSFDTGIRLSKEALIRYFFLPLGCELLQDKMCVISSNNPASSELYVKDCCERNLYAIGQNLSSGILKNESRSPGTAIFRYLDKLLIRYVDDPLSDEQITLYHFTNFAAGPEVQIYTLPFQAFRFYRETQKPRYKKKWNRFVNHQYRSSDFKKATYQDESNSFIVLDKKQEVRIEENEFRYWRNAIYDKLLAGTSIIRDIRKWSIDESFDLTLLKIYLIDIRNMKKETVEKINRIADFILSYTSETDMKKVLTRLNGMKNPYSLRRFILKVIAAYYQAGNENPLVTVEEYVDYLFPDSASWMETRDVLLISIYQKLHEKRIKVELENTGLDEDEFVDDKI